jgi:hypothetical protein
MAKFLSLLLALATTTALVVAAPSNGDGGKHDGGKNSHHPDNKICDAKEVIEAVCAEIRLVDRLDGGCCKSLGLIGQGLDFLHKSNPGLNLGQVNWEYKELGKDCKKWNTYDFDAAEKVCQKLEDQFKSECSYFPPNFAYTYCPRVPSQARRRKEVYGKVRSLYLLIEDLSSLFFYSRDGNHDDQNKQKKNICKKV